MRRKEAHCRRAARRRDIRVQRTKHRARLILIGGRAALGRERIDTKREIACERTAPRHVADMRVEATIFVDHQQSGALHPTLRRNEIALETRIRTGMATPSS